MNACPYKEYCNQECKIERPRDCQFFHLYADVGHNLLVIDNENGLEKVIERFEA